MTSLKNPAVLNVSRLELHVSYDCANRCIFCSEAGRLKRFSGLNPSPEEIAGILRVKRAEGFAHVTFTGGEPSLLKYLPQLLRIARALGYKICVTTNGYAFADARYAAGVLPILDEIILSVHGADNCTHDGLTRTPGGFARTVATLENINKLSGKSIFLITNTLALQKNVRELPGILRWLGSYKAVKQFLISCPAPEGRAAAGYDEIVADPCVFSGIVPELVGIAGRLGKIIRFFGVPACALGSYAEHSNDFHWAPRLTIERGSNAGTAVLREVLSLAPTRKRFYSAECIGCRVIGVCGGRFFAGRRPQLPRGKNRPYGRVYTALSHNEKGCR